MAFIAAGGRCPPPSAAACSATGARFRYLSISSRSSPRRRRDRAQPPRQFARRLRALYRVLEFHRSPL
jgi:hypothetical protein